MDENNEINYEYLNQSMNSIILVNDKFMNDLKGVCDYLHIRTGDCLRWLKDMPDAEEHTYGKYDEVEYMDQEAIEYIYAKQKEAIINAKKKVLETLKWRKAHGELPLTDIRIP